MGKIFPGVTTYTYCVCAVRLQTVQRAFETDGPQRQKAYIRTCVPSEDSDQPAHSRCLIRILTERILNS